MRLHVAAGRFAGGCGNIWCAYSRRCSAAAGGFSGECDSLRCACSFVFWLESRVNNTGKGYVEGADFLFILQLWAAPVA